MIVNLSGELVQIINSLGKLHTIVSSEVGKTGRDDIKELAVAIACARNAVINAESIAEVMEESK